MRKAWKHQEVAIPEAVDKKRYMLLWEPGTGKTFAAIQILRAWCQAEGRQLKTLIFGPSIVMVNWKREIGEHSKMGPRTYVLSGTQKERTKRARQEIGFVTGSILITNYEALSMKDLMKALDEWGPDVIIFDEIHRLKDPSGARAKAAVKFSKGVTYRLGLTGTSVLQSPMDLFNQVRLVDDGKLFGDNFFIFRARHFYDKNAGMPSHKHFPKWEPIPGSFGHISQRMKEIASVVKKEECLDLPPLIRQRVEVELSPQQRRVYKELERDFIAFMGDKACRADLAITKAIRMQQVVSGFIALEGDTAETEERFFNTNPRADALEEMLQQLAVDNKKKVIVWAVFKRNYETIRAVCDKLKLKYVEVHGEIKEKQKFENVDQFNQDPETLVFIGHPLSGGIGINLVSASYSIFYSRNFSLEADLQAEARNYRGGSEIHDRITRFDIVAKDTIDEHILESLENKLSVSMEILQGIGRKL